QVREATIRFSEENAVARPRHGKREQRKTNTDQRVGETPQEPQGGQVSSPTTDLRYCQSACSVSNIFAKTTAASGCWTTRRWFSSRASAPHSWHPTARASRRCSKSLRASRSPTAVASSCRLAASSDTW